MKHLSPLNLSLWLTLVLTLLRAAVVVGLEHLGAQRPLALTLEQLSRGLLGIAILAAILSATMATGACVVRHRSRASRWLACLVATLLATALVAGWFEGDATRAVGWETGRGRAVLAALLFACSTLSVVVFAAARKSFGGRGARGLVLPVALLAAVCIGGRFLPKGTADVMPLREVVDELLGSDWEVVESPHPSAGSLTVLCPSTSYRLRGADMPSLAMPPPSVVEATIPPMGGSAWVVARAGVDQTVHEDPRWAGHTVQFEARLDGVLVFESTATLTPGGEPRGSEWVPVADGSDPGLQVAGGERLRLSTALLGPDGAVVLPEEALSVGFGGLTCEKRWSAPRELSSPDRPNIVLVVMDTARADRFSAYGYERQTSPHLDALAARGRLFADARATGSWTWPSTASILTGLHPQEHGVVSPTSCYLSESLVTLPEVLQRAGYTTAAWSANPLIVPDKNFDQGFELFERGGDSPRQTKALMPAVLRWLESVSGTRFFLYLQLMDAHAPLRPLPEGRARFAPDVAQGFDSSEFMDLKRSLLKGAAHTADGRVITDEVIPPTHQRWFSDLYDASIWSGDQWFGELLAKLEQLELTEETVVVFTSDHGEELFDRGLAGHSHTLHRELVHVPLVMAGPGIPAGERIDTPVSNRHLAATLARIGGGRSTDLAVHDPLDLSGGPLDPSARERQLFFSTESGWWNGQHEVPLFGMRGGNFVFHWAPGGGDWNESPPEGGSWSLYDVSKDPHELNDLGANRADVASQMRSALQKRLDEFRERRVGDAVGAGEATLQMLNNIGYTGE